MNKPIPAITERKLRDFINTAFQWGMLYMARDDNDSRIEAQEQKESVKQEPNKYWATELLNEQERIALKAKLDMERILNDFEYIFAPDGYIRGDRRFVLGNMKKWLKQQLNRLAELKEGGE